MFLMFSGRCQKCYFSYDNARIRVQRVSLGEQNPVYSKFSKPERACESNDYEKQPHIHLQDTEMHQASNNLCNGTCSLTLSSHLESTFGWWQSSFGILQVLSETFSCMGHPGKRPLSGLALSDRRTVSLCSHLHQVHRTQRGFALPLDQGG